MATLTETGRPSQRAEAASARSSTQSVSGPISVERSTAGRNSVRSASRSQRSSASAPRTAPVRASTSGWKCRSSSPRLERLADLVDELALAAGGERRAHAGGERERGPVHGAEQADRGQHDRDARDVRPTRWRPAGRSRRSRRRARRRACGRWRCRGRSARRRARQPGGERGEPGPERIHGVGAHHGLPGPGGGLQRPQDVAADQHDAADRQQAPDRAGAPAGDGGADQRDAQQDAVADRVGERDDLRADADVALVGRQRPAARPR